MSTDLSTDPTPPDSLCTLFFNLPDSVWSNFSKCKLSAIVKRYCKDLKIKLIISSFKVENANEC